MLAKVYYFFHRLVSSPAERGEYSSGHWQDKIRKAALFLCKDIKGRVLEVGCGEGLFLIQLARQNYALDVYGIDNSNIRINQALGKIKAFGFKNINAAVDDAKSLHFDDSFFDAVICVNVLFNLDSLDSAKKALTEMSRVLKIGGRLILDFRNSLNPLLLAKYKLAKYYDKTVEGLPLTCYAPAQVESILTDLGLKVKHRMFIGFKPIKIFAPIVVIEAEKYDRQNSRS